MLNYIKAELYKLTHRAYPYGFLAIVLALEGVMVGVMCWSNSHVDGYLPFSDAISILAPLLTMGLYLPLILGDMVFSDQYKHNTLKNEVSFGLPRTQIYLGKLITVILNSIVLSAIMVTFYVALAALLLPMDQSAAAAMQMLGYCLAFSFPLWLGAVGVSMFFFFLVRNSTVASMAFVLPMLVLPQMLQIAMLSARLRPLAEALYRILLSTPFSVLNGNLNGELMIYAWAVGLGWFAVSTLVGVVAFRKREMN